jgi:Domain of unknown function (DUF4334)/GXWXG protein
LFDALPPVRAEDITGRWAGRELGTGHRLDGALAASGWHGKRFDSMEDVFPLVFSTTEGRMFTADPRRIPLELTGKVPTSTIARARPLLAALKPALGTTRPRARLRNLEYRGVVTAAMIYDHLPIIDVFRLVDEVTLLGAMDWRDDPQPYFFVLAKES